LKKLLYTHSLSGVVPRLQFDHGSKFEDPKYKYSQGYRIDPLHSLLSLKEGAVNNNKKPYF